MAYVKGYAVCQQMKNLTHHTKVPLYRVSVSDQPRPFGQIAMDLIMGLPVSNATVHDRVQQLIEQCVHSAAAINSKGQGMPQPQWQTGHKVWLEAKNLAVPYGTAKLAPRRHGPFMITQVVSPVAYRLQLPTSWKIHPVFHASLLTPYIETPERGPNYSWPAPDLIEGTEEYKVESIHNHRHHGPCRQLQYLLK